MRVRTMTGLLGGILLAAIALPAVAVPPVELGASHVYDDPAVDVLTADEERAGDERLAALSERTGIDLWAVFVDDFDDLTAQEWADEVAVDNGLGQDQYLLAVGVDARQYYVSAPQDGPLSDDQLQRLDAAIASALNDEDWAGAIDAAATQIEQSRGGAGGGSALAWLVGLLVVAGIVVAIVLVIRSRRRGAAASAPAPDAVPTEELRKRATSALIAADDAIASSEQELGFAIAQFGDGATAEFREALQAARQRLDGAFELKQRLDDSEPDTEEQVRAWNAEIARLCDEATATLAEKAETFQELRQIEKDVPAALERARAAIAAATGSDDRAAEALADLRSRYAPEALGDVADNAEQARERLRTAQAELDEAQALLAAGRNGEAASAVVVAERAADQAVALARAAADLGAALATAEQQAAALVAELEGDVARARQNGSTDPAVAAAEQAVTAAKQQLAGGARRPRVLLERLQEANHQIDAVIASAQRSQQLLQQAILQAQAAVASADQFIAQRRGAVGADARTRLAQARASLAQAQALQGTDPAQALPHAQRALQLAETASQLAQSDLGGMMGGGMFGGSGGGGMGDALIGGIIGGLLSGGGSRRSSGWSGGLGVGLGGGLGGARGGGGRRSGFGGSFGGGGRRSGLGGGFGGGRSGRRGGGRF